MAYDTTELIAAVKAAGSIPTSQNLFSNSDFLRFANHEMQTNLVPLVMSAREEYFVASYDHTVTADQASYRIPARAIGGKLRDVQLIDGTEFKSLPRLEPENITSSDQGREGFYIQGNSIVLSPTPTVTQGTLRLKYFVRPGSLILLTACGVISSINTVANTVTLTSTPSTFGNGTSIDFVRATPGFEPLAVEQSITGVSGTTLNFSSLPSGLAVGDYVCLTGESPVPQIPVELHPVLIQAVLVRILQAQKKDAKMEFELLQEMKRNALLMLTPRIDGEPRKITNPNGLLNKIRRGF